MAVQFNDTKFKLKYLFSAELEDGSIYEQNSNDVSKTDKTKSSFFDIKDEKIKRFWLKRFGEKHEINLQTGEFTVNGVKFMTHDENLKDLRLVYYRRHKHNFKESKEIAHRVEYHFGFQATFNGENVKRIIMLK